MQYFIHKSSVIKIHTLELGGEIFQRIPKPILLNFLHVRGTVRNACHYSIIFGRIFVVCWPNFIKTCFLKFRIGSLYHLSILYNSLQDGPKNVVPHSHPKIKKSHDPPLLFGTNEYFTLFKN